MCRKHGVRFGVEFLEPFGQTWYTVVRIDGVTWVVHPVFIKHCETQAAFDKVVGNVRGVNWCLVLNLKLFELLTKYVENKRYYKVRGKGVNFSVEHRGVN